MPGPAALISPAGPHEAPFTPPDMEIGLFWDFENVHIPKGCDANTASTRLREAVQKFGYIVDKRLYYDSEKERSADRSGLQSSGFTLVDTPTRNKKETLDKHMVADLVDFAWKYRARNMQCIVALVASDGDYAYALAKARDLGMRTLVIHGPGTQVAEALLNQSDAALNWKSDVLGIVERASPPAPETPADEEDAHSTDELASIADAQDGIHLGLCYAMRQLRQERDSLWLPDNEVAARVYQNRGGIVENERYVAVRDSAVQGGFVEVGRRVVPSKTDMSIFHSTVWKPKYLDKYSTEFYLRLTPSGEAQLQDTAEAARMARSATISRMPSVRESVTPPRSPADGSASLMATLTLSESGPIGRELAEGEDAIAAASDASRDVQSARLAAAEASRVIIPSEAGPSHTAPAPEWFSGEITYAGDGFYIANGDIWISMSSFKQHPPSLELGTIVHGVKVWRPKGQNNWIGSDVTFEYKETPFYAAITFVDAGFCVVDKNIWIHKKQIEPASHMVRGSMVRGTKIYKPRGQNIFEASKVTEVRPSVG